MRRYELVVLIDPRLPQDEVQKLWEQIKGLLPAEAIKDEDWIGLLPLEYKIDGVDRAYFGSLYLELDPQKVAEAKEQLRLLKGVLRFFFYKMEPDEKFFKFKELNAMLQEQLDQAASEEVSGQFGDMEAGQQQQS